MAVQEPREIQDILARRDLREALDHVVHQDPPLDTPDQRDSKDRLVAMEDRAAMVPVDLTEIQAKMVYQDETAAQEPRENAAEPDHVEMMASPDRQEKMAGLARTEEMDSMAPLGSTEVPDQLDLKETADSMEPQEAKVTVERQEPPAQSDQPEQLDRRENPAGTVFLEPTEIREKLFPEAQDATEAMEPRESQEHQDETPCQSGQ